MILAKTLRFHVLDFRVMDSCSLISKAKRQKVNGKQDPDECNKSLDDFPDAILEYMLSFLPTKNAVGTGILSKRWRYLWTHLPNLDFQEALPAKRLHFMNFVERVLVLCDNFCIKKFSLSCSVKSDTSRINAWISAGVRRKAQEFNICLDDVIETWVLPHCLFRCETVEVLKLAFPDILKLPSQICLSNLKILTLENVVFSDDHSTKLLFSGPVLEELTLRHVTFSRDYPRELLFCGPALAKLVIEECNLVNLWRIIVSAPKLWNLTIHDMDDESWNDFRPFRVMIDGPGLRVLKYRGKGNYWISCPSSLMMVSIDIPSFCKESTDVANNVYKFLKRFAFVQHIKLSTNVVEVLDHASDLLVNMPDFFMTFLEFGPEPVELTCKVLEKILPKCYRLEHILNAEEIFRFRPANKFASKFGIF